MAARRPLAAIALFGVVLASAAPQPSIIPKRWQLDIRPGPLRIISLEDESGTVLPYFYFSYLVTNNTGRDMDFFAPSFELATDEGDLRRSGAGVAPEIAEQLLEKLHNPLLEGEIHIAGHLLQGEENAKEGLVIWVAEDLQTDEVIVFAEGFSGETRRIIRPDTGEEVVLRKTLMLRHATPGTLQFQGARPLERTMERWILR